MCDSVSLLDAEDEVIASCGNGDNYWHGLTLRGINWHGLTLRGINWHGLTLRGINWHGLTLRGIKFPFRFSVLYPSRRMMVLCFQHLNFLSASVTLTAGKSSFGSCYSNGR
jgi:uncharacterized protein YjbI with pentapeptide repeats